jgi:BirA family biotin operon repressor/biotin-[acetyl-CoA-carboxylase] ligase
MTSQPFKTLALKTHVIGRSIEWHEQVGSTNHLAGAALSQGRREGFVIGAEIQTAGRGRMGRSWESEAGHDLTFSIGLTPHVLPTDLPIFSVMTPLALCQAVEPFLPPETKVTIKWPNDLMWKGKKWCGILLESKLGTQKSPQIPLVIGIGVNVNSSIHEADPARVGNATSLQKISGKTIDRMQLFQQILLSLDRYYADLTSALPNLTKLKENWLDQYKSRSSLLGYEISLQVGTKRFQGIARDFDAQFGLQVELTDGSYQTFRAEQTTVISLQQP